jgi:alcohol dehydrogenase
MSASNINSLEVDSPPLQSATQVPFDFHWPVRLVFGCDSLNKLGELMSEYGGRRALVVSDQGVVTAGHTARAIASLEASDIEVFLFDKVDENPTTRHVDQATTFARENKIDCIVGIGGGSSVDTAKGANFLITNGGRMEDYWGVGKAKKPMLPMIAIPTTAGTGAETQSFALIVNEETGQKMACGDKKALCKAAILDPNLTLTLPSEVTAASGIDAISHVVESWVSKPRNAISCMFASQAWSSLVGAYDLVATAPQDIEARSGMLIGAALAGAAIEHSMLGAAHSCANPITARLPITHGVAVGVMLPHIVRFNAPVCGELYGELLARGGIAISSGASAAETLADWLTERLQCHGLPVRLSDIGVSAVDLPEMALQASKQWTAEFNPQPVSLEDF